LIARSLSSIPDEKQGFSRIRRGAKTWRNIQRYDAMQQSRRPQRLEVQIQHEVSLMISRDLKDPRVGFVTVTGVRLSPDLRHARVFVSAMGTEKQRKESLEALNHAAGWIRRELGQRVRMKFLPDIIFDVDTSQEYGERIDRLLDDIRES
jgi:ribosome-binding factor A